MHDKTRLALAQRLDAIRVWSRGVRDLLIQAVSPGTVSVTVHVRSLDALDQLLDRVYAIVWPPEPFHLHEKLESALHHARYAENAAGIADEELIRTSDHLFDQFMNFYHRRGLTHDPPPNSTPLRILHALRHLEQIRAICLEARDLDESARAVTLTRLARRVSGVMELLELADITPEEIDGALETLKEIE